MCTPKASRPNAISTTTCTTVSASEAVTREARNSHSGIGVSFSRRRIPRLRQSTSTVDRPNTDEVMIAMAMMPGSRKSM